MQSVFIFNEIMRSKKILKILKE